MNGGDNGEENEGEPSVDREDPGDADDGLLSRPVAGDASGFGLSMTLLTGVLLAFGYYGTRSVLEAGFGRAIPPPFYLLALALIFVVELSRSRSFDARGLARAVGITAVFGTLIVLAVEGGAYLWERPRIALDEFAGVAVLAVAIVVAALAYVVYLSVVEQSRRAG